MSVRRVVRAGVIALAVAALAAGCAAAPAEPRESPESIEPGAAPLPAGVAVSFVQLRSDVADRTAQLRVENDSSRDLRIQRITFFDDWFDAPVVRDRDSVVPAGRTVDLRIALPASACEGEPAASERESSALIEYETDAGSYVSTVDVPDPLAALAELHAKECLAHDVAAAVHLELTAFEPSPSGTPATLVLTVDPSGDGSAEIVAMRQTNLLWFGGTAGAAAEPFRLGLAITPESEPITIEVPLVPTRCDPHAVLEDKRGTVFPLEVSADGVTGIIELASSDDMRGRMLTWVTEWCGAGN